MRLALVTVAAFLAGCAAESTATRPSSAAHGATLSLVRSSDRKPTFELKNSGSAPLAYNHWFSLGPEPAAYCRGADGNIRFCSLRFMLAEDGQPYTHESYLQPGKVVTFQAAPSSDEEVGVHIWIEGREEAVWLGGWTPNKSLERTRAR
jgi:hypothetical protein